MVMRRGEVRWADLPKPLGIRPVVLLSLDEAYKARSAVTIAEVSTNIRDIPVEVRLGKEDGLPKQCVANLDAIITIRKSLLKECICMLGYEKLESINSAVKFALDLE
jgi:mRNA interferase MazF